MSDEVNNEVKEAEEKAKAAEAAAEEAVFQNQEKEYE